LVGNLPVSEHPEGGEEVPLQAVSAGSGDSVPIFLRSTEFCRSRARAPPLPRRWRLNQHVVVIAYQAVSMRQLIEPPTNLVHGRQERAAVIVREEDVMPLVASRGNVVQCPSEFDAKRSRHSLTCEVVTTP